MTDSLRVALAQVSPRFLDRTATLAKVVENVHAAAARGAKLVADLEFARVLEERQNFDPTAHYSRPDVLGWVVDRRRQRVAEWIDG